MSEIPPHCREALLSAPVSAWFEAQGFTVYAEVPFFSSPIDLVARRGEELAVVELKQCLTQEVIRSACVNRLISDDSWCGVGTRPRARGVASARDEAVGVLSVRDGVARVVARPELAGRRSIAGAHHAGRIHGYLDNMEPGGVGGLPGLKGVGPAQDVERGIEQYREAHPKATWKELYDQVPNHYASAASMYCAMRMLEDRRWRKQMEREGAGGG